MGINNDTGNRYIAVDITKVLLAVVIIIGHIDLLSGWPNLYDFFSRFIFPLALPLFFLFSGFFYKPSNCDCSQSIPWVVCLKKVKRVLVLYLVWLIPNLPTAYIKLHNIGSGWGIISTACFSGVYMASWYLVSLIWCMLIVTALSHLSPRFYICFSLALGLVCLLLCEGFIPDYFHVVRFFTPYSFLRGLLFFSLGVLIRGMILSKVFLYLGFLLSLLSVFFVNISILGRIMSVFFVGLSLIHFSPSSSMAFGKFLRNTSTILYLGHPTYSIFLRHYVSKDPMVVFILVVATLTLFSILVFFKEKKYPVLGYLH